MKILAAVTLLLLVVAVRAGDPGDSSVLSYPDTCNYNERDTEGWRAISASTPGMTTVTADLTQSMILMSTAARRTAPWTLVIM